MKILNKLILLSVFLLLIPLTNALPYTYLSLNGTQGNFYYLNNSYAKIQVVVDTWETIYLDTNITGWTTKSGYSPFTQIILLNAKKNNTYYNITGYFPGNETHNSSSKTYYAIVYNKETPTFTTTTSTTIATTTATTSTTTTTTVQTPTLYVSISADPSSGTAPLNGVDLNSTVWGTATGDIVYQFDCNLTYGGNGIFELTTPATTTNPYKAIDLCNYTNPGWYTITVNITRSGLKASAHTNIYVSSSSTTTTTRPTIIIDTTTTTRLTTTTIPPTTTTRLTTTTIYRGGGCPTLFVYNGKYYVKERKSNIHSQPGIDTVDDIVLTTKPAVVDGNYLLQLKETTLPEHSYIDSVRLFVTDSEGKKEAELVSAKHSKYGDVTDKLTISDNIRTDTQVFDNIELKFAVPKLKGEVKSFTFEIEGYNPATDITGPNDITGLVIRPGFYKMDIADFTLIAVVVVVIIIALIFVVFKFFVKKNE